MPNAFGTGLLLRCRMRRIAGPQGRRRRWRRTFKEAPGTEFELKADLVLLALGFLHVEHGPIVEQLGLATDDRGNLVVDANFQTNVPGVFAAGDTVAGASLVVRAIAQGRQMAAAVDAFLRRLPQT